MATVYLLFEGENADRRCVAAFSTREAAWWGRNGHGDADIEEHELDGRAGQRFVPTYWARVNVATGEVERAENPVTRLFDPDGPCDVDEYFGLIRVCSPVSFEHAEKAAVELRRAKLRERAAGVTGG